jgi:integrase
MRKIHRIQARFFTWNLALRNGIWQADGRSNSVDLKRHSLGTREFEEAKQFVHDLDLHMAVKLGLAAPHLLERTTDFGLPVELGVEVFRKSLQRPMTARGVSPATRKRYERILKAQLRFFEEKNIQFWEQVTEDLLDEFAIWRTKKCKESTVATELSLFCQVHRYLIRKKRLDPRHALDYSIFRPTESTRFCPSETQVKAILQKLGDDASNAWLADTTILLCFTGMRFSELAQMTYDDVVWVNEDPKTGKGFLQIRHETTPDGKKTKSKYSRKVPISPIVATVLRALSRSPDDDLLVHGPCGGKIRSDMFSKHLRKLALKPLASRFPQRQFQTITAHCFRHFFASICAANNISQQTVMDWMGHRSDSMAKRYFHQDDEASLRNIEKIDPKIDESEERTEDSDSKPNEPETDDNAADDTGKE